MVWAPIPNPRAFRERTSSQLIHRDSMPSSASQKGTRVEPMKSVRMRKHAAAARRPAPRRPQKGAGGGRDEGGRDKETRRQRPPLQLDRGDLEVVPIPVIERDH